jgi:hypothetical protein
MNDSAAWRSLERLETRGKPVSLIPNDFFDVLRGRGLFPAKSRQNQNLGIYSSTFEQELPDDSGIVQDRHPRFLTLSSCARE